MLKNITVIFIVLCTASAAWGQQVVPVEQVLLTNNDVGGIIPVLMKKIDLKAVYDGFQADGSFIGCYELKIDNVSLLNSVVQARVRAALGRIRTIPAVTQWLKTTPAGKTLFTQEEFKAEMINVSGTFRSPPMQNGKSVVCGKASKS